MKEEMHNLVFCRTLNLMALYDFMLFAFKIYKFASHCVAVLEGNKCEISYWTKKKGGKWKIDKLRLLQLM